MYEYTPNRKKTRELITALTLTGVAIAVYYVSQIPKIPYPVLFQLGAVFLLVGAIILITRFVMRSFTCRVEPTDAGVADFVIVEHYGRRDTVVCRISLDQVRSVERPDRQNRQALAEKQKGKRVYHYTAEFSAPDLCVVEAAEEDTSGNEITVFIRICADETLFDILFTRNSNNCPSNNEK